MNETNKEFKKRLQEREPYYEQIAPALWLMNNHKWAYLAWETSCSNRPARLAHLDRHWDGINDFKHSKDIAELLNLQSPEDVKKYIKANEYKIRRDSFIAPAIIRGLIDEVYFYCLQSNTTPGLDSSLLVKFDTTERRCKSVKDLVNSINDAKPLIMDLDLDLFNRSSPWYLDGEGLTERVLSVIESCKELFALADVVTIAKSPGSWYIENDSRYDWDPELSETLSQVIVPKILSARNSKLT